MRAGIPIALGYFAVSIALGITAKKAGISSLQAALTSLLINASAGEYAGFSLIAAGATYLEVALMEAVANARYLLMSAALSQKLKSGVGTVQRLLLGFTVTDEIFGVSMVQPEPLDPFFTYGTFCVATAGWTGGTFVGAVLGDILPLRLLSALSVGLYGMFISVFIPEARKNRVVLVLVGISFAASLACSYLPWVRDISEGIRIIVLTVVISLVAAIVRPIPKEASEEVAEQ
ncbi:MAG: AzlC family ABC transporter permease [Ruminococcaceae bacterium]|nr:AzlC family ABC transporter permease [Oscillospiraceae bacterium]